MFTLNDVLEGNQGRISLSGPENPDPALIFGAAQHDSRRVQPGDLFVAIKGEHADGQRFMRNAMEAGALATLSVEPDPALPAHFLQIIVPDCFQALQAAARVRIHRQPEVVRIGITGSSGKTSTKEAIAAVLTRLAPTLKTYSSYNNELGYPITLLDVKPEHRFAVLEMGAERVGELKWLCETIARPHWSVITTVGAAHLKHFGSIENIAIAKSELVQCLAPEGLAFLNFDDPTVRAMAQKTQARVIFYGCGEGATVRATDVEGDKLRGCRFTLHLEDQHMPIQLHIPGEHGVTTALAAAAVGYMAGVPLEDIRLALESLAPVDRRGVIRSGPNGSTVIDDSYNAIRQAIIAITRAIQASPLEPGGKRWAILGGLLEQGEYTQAEHEASGAALVGTFDYLIAIGENARFFVDGAINAGMAAAHTFYFPARIEDAAELEKAKQAAADLIKARVTAADVILVKGSNGVRMNTLFTLFE